MKIVKMAFENYKNLDGFKVEFNSDISFLIGENGVGKTNILNSLNSIFSIGKFSEEDYFDTSKKIKINFTLQLEDVEIGVFDDYFDPSDKNKVNLVIEQEMEDSYFSVIHAESGDLINQKILKNINFIYYNSMRNPNNDLSFEKTKGASNFLNYLIRHYLVKNSESDKLFVQEDKTNKILCFIKEKINKIQAVERNNISPIIDLDNANFLTKLFLLLDSNGIALKNTGYGIQFNLLIMFSLLDRIVEIVERNNKNGEPTKEVRCVLSFDEPEIHLHPFMQRTIINDIQNIAIGKDEKFNSLLKELFGIEQFEAQILVVSHSDRIIGNNYKKIIRIFSEAGKVQSVTGYKLVLSQNPIEHKKLEKHLLMQFPYFCEAMFARCVIFVEGETEYGAIPGFAKKMKIELDRLGIYIIRASGEGSIIPLIKLFDLYKIPVIGILDRDVYKESIHKEYVDKKQLYVTQQLDFESEIINSINNFDVLKQMLENADIKLDDGVQPGDANKRITKYNLNLPKVETNILIKDILDKDIKYKYLFYLCKMVGSKTITFGRMIGDFVCEEMIPILYKTVINNAVEGAKNGRL